MSYSGMVTIADDKIRDQVVRLADMAVARPFVQGLVFENCMILGPAVVAMLNGGTLEGCSFDSPPEALLWEVPADTTKIGAIGLDDCTFVNCHFQGVGFAGTPEFAEKFTAGLLQQGS